MNVMKLITQLFKAGALISLTAMIFVVSVQVFARYFLEATPHWTEEAARICFIYSVGFGTAIGLKNGDFIRLDLMGRYLSPAGDRILSIASEILILAFSVVLLIYSFRFVELGMDELSPAMKMTMGFVFASTVLIGLAIFIFTLWTLYTLLTNKPND
jgi:TRAP-type transport system small permease protein